MSNLVEKVKAKVDNVLHKDHNDTTGTHATGTHTTGTGVGAHTGTHATGTGVGVGSHNTTTTAGPHDSNLANKADPRVDSDRDGSTNMGAAQHGPGAHNTSHTGAGLGAGVGAGSHHTTGAHIGAGTTHHAGDGLGHNTSSTTTAGPHSSNIANKLDPRVDSDRDGSTNMGAAQHGPGAHNTSHTTGTGLGAGTTGGYGSTTGGYGSTNAGPHDSNLANKVDPRVDSDRDGSRNAGAAAYGPGATNTGNTFGQGHTGVGAGTTGIGSTGHHAGHTAGVGAGTTGLGSTGNYAGQGGLGSGTGPASNTAGPHKSDMLNKADPRVDSDLDGSRTVGGNNTQNY
ncbi:hypothetical protein BT63DRAFT_419425 [Microthyrium microscopicum]|uniref:Cell surface protein n=1 Tax=Microthyrium microscopicum TaxID=703497 RepID=A0A6A6UP98_9PEZI|nr:hypothetical protein BT63DRAFT_419425 [Microthyrium microscopicum]